MLFGQKVTVRVILGGIMHPKLCQRNRPAGMPVASDPGCPALSPVAMNVARIESPLDRLSLPEVRLELTRVELALENALRSSNAPQAGLIVEALQTELVRLRERLRLLQRR
jgi:hypothetical protein